MENHNPSSQIPKKKRKLVELLECKDYIVPLNPDVIVKKTIYRSSARITDRQRNQVKRVLRSQWYQGRISSIRYTRVNYKYSFRTCLDTLTFDLILVKLDQKQEFLIHEKLCTPL
ncbi:hypothetical protein [Lactiplantibacillus plantarum]|uniref:hypothetical protein n=1 Tax=Lactiplantibacillus plantarum TaxID=1590 RepID=UPI0012B7029D|nr:hypothetical protein [Lactiplantibacillus plantarum]